MPDDTLPLNLAANAFAGTAQDYARYRPPYPAHLIDRLLAETARHRRLLDLASGPGRVALDLARNFGEVLAVDSEPDMIETGRRLAHERGITNISWRLSRVEELEAPFGSTDLITVGEAFHRLDQKRVLESATHWLASGGVLATMGSNGLLGSQPWHRVIHRICEEWTRDAFPGGWAQSMPGALTGPGALRDQFQQFGLVDVVEIEFPTPHSWRIEDILGYLRSMSVCAPQVLGDRRPAFEEAIAAALLDFNPTGQFEDVLQFGLTVARQP